jgi:hypothetical protein
MNWRGHISTGIGLLLLITAIIGWFVDKGSNFFTTITWKDQMEVVSFNNTASLVAKNSGDGDVFLERIEIRSRNTQKAFITFQVIEEVLRKGEFKTFKLGDGILGGGKILFDDGEYKAGQETINRLIENPPKNIQRLVYNKDNERVKVFKEKASWKEINFEATATITFHSLNKKEPLTHTFDCIGFFVKTN